MKYQDLLRYRDAGDLKAMIDALYVYWHSKPKVNRRRDEIGEMMEDVLSYRRRLDKIPAEYVSILWRCVKFLVEEVADMDSVEIIDEVNKVSNLDAITDGFYWVFPDNSGKQFYQCESFLDFMLENQQLFIDGLSIDPWKMMHTRHSSQDDLIGLALSSGAILTEIFHMNGRKRARFQCCQCSVPWLKKKIFKMPLVRSIIRVYDSAKPYKGFGDGIMFVLSK